MTTPQRQRRRLLLRIYLHSVILSTLLITSMVVLARVVLRPSPHRDAVALRTFLVHELAAERAEPAALAKDIAFLRASHARVTLYAADGTLIATTESPPAPPLAPKIVDTLVDAAWTPLGRDGAAVASAIVGDDGRAIGYAVVRLPGRPYPITWLAWSVGLMLIFAGVASILFARSLARPLGRLADVARSFGRGDLAARAGLERKDELGDVGRAFDDMAARVQQLLRAQRELLANVSHELRTPLSRIRVALDLAAEGDAALARESLAEIGVDLNDLERLVEDVLTAARLELAAEVATTPVLQREPVDVAALVETTATRFRTTHATHPLSVDVPSSLPPLDADTRLVRRVLDNLLDNARKYSEPGEPIVLRAARADGQVRLEVIDHGIGIDPADLPQLFTPFFRTDRSRARATGGVGLGLVIARRIAEAHGGTLTITSPASGGATAVLSLPVPAATPVSPTP